MQTSIQKPKKPIPLRVIFLLNAMMAVLPFLFYYVFTSQNLSIGQLNPLWMVYTGLAYLISFAFLVYNILHRSIWGVRIMFMLNILIALPAGAYIGILVAIISLALSFYNDKVLQFFDA